MLQPQNIPIEIGLFTPNAQWVDVTAANMSALDLAALGNLESLLCTAVRFDLRHVI